MSNTDCFSTCCDCCKGPDCQILPGVTCIHMPLFIEVVVDGVCGLLNDCFGGQPCDPDECPDGCAGICNCDFVCGTHRYCEDFNQTFLLTRIPNTCCYSWESGPDPDYPDGYPTGSGPPPPGDPCSSGGYGCDPSTGIAVFACFDIFTDTTGQFGPAFETYWVIRVTFNSVLSISTQYIVVMTPTTILGSPHPCEAIPGVGNLYFEADCNWPPTIFVDF